jgi:hypothetical protein
MVDSGRITGMNWMRKEWEEIRPHIKAHIVIVAGTAVISATGVWITRFIQNQIGVSLLPTRFYIVLAVLIFCALLLSIILLFVLSRFLNGSSSPASQAPPVIPTNKTASELAVTKAVDLRGQFDEMFFFRPVTGMEAFFSYPYSVLFKLTITNVGTDETTIVGWNLGLWMGNDFLGGKITKIPASWHIRRYGTDLYNLNQFHDEPLEEKIDKLPSGEAFRKGIPRTGWIAFEVQAWQGELPHNAYFRIVAKDSFGNEHNFDRPAQNYIKTGELVSIEQPLLESGKTGLSVTIGG